MSTHITTLTDDDFDADGWYCGPLDLSDLPGFLVLPALPCQFTGRVGVARSIVAAGSVRAPSIRAGESIIAVGSITAEEIHAGFHGVGQPIVCADLAGEITAGYQVTTTTTGGAA